MIGYIVTFIALAAVADATLLISSSTAAAGAVTTFSAVGATQLAVLGGVAILKGILLARLLRSKRSTHIDNEDAVFTILAAQEPAQCYRRLICDLSAGAIPDNDKLVTLFNDEVSPVSAKFEFAAAAKVGKMVKSAHACEVRYACPLSTNEIQKLFN